HVGDCAEVDKLFREQNNEDQQNGVHAHLEKAEADSELCTQRHIHRSIGVNAQIGIREHRHAEAHQHNAEQHHKDSAQSVLTFVNRFRVHTLKNCQHCFLPRCIMCTYIASLFC